MVEIFDMTFLPHNRLQPLTLEGGLVVEILDRTIFTQ